MALFRSNFFWISFFELRTDSGNILSPSHAHHHPTLDWSGMSFLLGGPSFGLDQSQRHFVYMIFLSPYQNSPFDHATIFGTVVGIST